MFSVPMVVTGLRFSLAFVGLCLFFCTMSQTPLQTELDTEMFQHESWKTIYFGGGKNSKGQKSKSWSTENSALWWVFAGFFEFIMQ